MENYTYHYSKIIIDEHSSIIKKLKNNTIIEIMYFYDKKLYNQFGPADIEFFDDGKQIKKIIYNYSTNDNVRSYNPNGPAEIEYYNNGNKKFELYSTIICGMPHRENGPAIIYYNEDGSIKYKKYFINGEEINNELQIEIIKSN